LSTSALKFSSAQWSSTIGTSRSSISAHNCRDIHKRTARRTLRRTNRPAFDCHETSSILDPAPHVDAKKQPRGSTINASDDPEVTLHRTAKDSQCGLVVGAVMSSDRLVEAVELD
jgi:hypothetical protein